MDVAGHAFDQRDETDSEEFLDPVAAGLLGDAQELLAVLTLDRNDHDAALGELVQESLRQFSRRGGDDDALEWGLRRPALETVAKHGGDIRQAQMVEARLGVGQQQTMAFDGVHPAAKKGEYR